LNVEPTELRFAGIRSRRCERCGFTHYWRSPLCPACELSDDGINAQGDGAQFVEDRS